MAYKKNYRRGKGRRYRRSRRGPTNLQAVSKLASTAYSGYKWLKSVVNVEKKFVDKSVLLTSVTYSGTGGNLCFDSMTQGNGASQRSGDVVKLTTVDINVTTYADTSGTYPAVVRFIVVRGRNENGAGPALSDILTVTGSQQVVNSLRNVNKDAPFEVLLDRKWHISSGETAVASKSFHLNLQHHLQFQSASVTPESGGLYYFIMSDRALAANQPNYTLYARLRYVDN